MKIVEWQVSSRELSEKLKALGIEQKSVFYWSGPELRLTTCNLLGDVEESPNYSAFTVAELGEMLPWPIVSGINRNGKFMCYDDSGNSFTNKWFGEGSEVEVRAKMLITLIESNLIDPKNTRRKDA